MKNRIYLFSCVCIGLLVCGFGCASIESHSMSGTQSSFGSPDAAFAALADAARANSTSTLRQILGPDADALLDTSDPVQLEANLHEFARLYDERHVLEPMDNGGVGLIVGGNEWPMPIPVVKTGDRWTFDSDSGIEELINRRIGANELSAIEVCRAIVDAQEEYRALNPEGTGAYAEKFFSDPQRKNGLYWPTQSTETASPLGPLVVAAAGEGYERGTVEEPAPYHGYRYRILTGQGASAPGGARSYFVDGHMTGGFAVVAWPAEYGNSGIMTFLIDRFGVVYERDLGENTAEIAGAMRTFDPDADWRVFVDEDSVVQTQ